MEPKLVNAVTLPGSVGSADMSIIGLFLQADYVVKAVMLALIVASFWCWAIIFDKIMRLRRLQAQASEFEEQFWSGAPLEDLYDRLGSRPDEPMSAIFSSAMREWRRSASKGLVGSGPMRASLRQRIEQVMQITLQREMGQVERYMTFLASVGSTAPFIGLFGTVWGIMNSFKSIAMTKNTSIAVVAPGIAEALFATALGLIAAIPAVIAYNKISSDIGRYTSRLEGFAAEFAAIVSRQLDEAE